MPLATSVAPAEKKHNHYFRPCPYDHIDVYRVLELFNVADPCLQHAIKKLLVAGGRGAGKSIDKDIQESIDSLERWQAMRVEEGHSKNVEALKTTVVNGIACLREMLIKDD